jgi:hypothetical protein
MAAQSSGDESLAFKVKPSFLQGLGIKQSGREWSGTSPA